MEEDHLTGGEAAEGKVTMVLYRLDRFYTQIVHPEKARFPLVFLMWYLIRLPIHLFDRVHCVQLVNQVPIEGLKLGQKEHDPRDERDGPNEPSHVTKNTQHVQHSPLHPN